MRATWPLYLGALAPGLIVLVAAWRRITLPGPRRWLVAWAGASLCFDGAAFFLARRAENNHLIVYGSTVALPMLALMALGGWHSGVLRTAYRLAVPALAGVTLLLILSLERLDTFSRIAAPFEALTVAMASAGVLLVRSRSLDTGLLWREDWFWASMGLLLRFAAGASLTPLAAHFVATDPGRVILAYEIISVVDAVAAALIAGAVLCPIRVSGLSL